MVTIRMDGSTLRAENVGDPLELWDALMAFFKAARPTKPGTGLGLSKIPQTTNDDIRQSLALFDAAYRRDQRDDLHGAEANRKRLDAIRELVTRGIAGKPPADTFAECETFWRETRRLALTLSSFRDQPTRWERAVESVDESIRALPARLEWGASKAADVAHGALEATADAAGEILETTGNVAGRAARGLLGPIGLPLLIGGGVLAAVLIVPRFLGGRGGAS